MKKLAFISIIMPFMISMMSCGTTHHLYLSQKNIVTDECYPVDNKKSIIELKDKLNKEEAYQILVNSVTSRNNISDMGFDKSTKPHYEYTVTELVHQNEYQIRTNMSFYPFEGISRIAFKRNTNGRICSILIVDLLFEHVDIEIGIKEDANETDLIASLLFLAHNTKEVKNRWYKKCGT